MMFWSAEINSPLHDGGLRSMSLPNTACSGRVGTRRQIGIFQADG
jgi:hypothetical protein